MQTYAIRMFNFLRFGEKGNSIVFDLTPQEKLALKNGQTTMDSLYDNVMKNPVQHVLEAKRRGLEHILGITGFVDGNPDFSNGVGKSTIMEAMCYSRYEKIVRKTATNPDKVERAGLSVVTKIDGKYPDGMLQSWVEELCEIGGNIYRIRRGREFVSTQKSNTAIMQFECLYEGVADSMSSHRKNKTKETLSDVLTMDYDLFVNSQMFGQNDAGKYLTGTDKVKKEMLIALLRLEHVVSGCLENVRKKKSDQEKKINTIKANIDILECGICKKHVEVTSKPLSIFGEELITEILSAFSITKCNHEKESQQLVIKIQSVDDEISKLSNSDKLQKVEAIKEDGRRVQKDKKAKEQVMLSQIEEWEKLEKDTSTTITKKLEQINLNLEKKKKLEDQILSTNTYIKGFDSTKHQDQLKRVEKGKSIKPQIINDLSSTRTKLIDINSKLAIKKSELNKAKLEKSKLQSQIDKMGDNSTFECSECKSIVSEQHIKSKISHFETEEPEFIKDIASYETELSNIKLQITGLEDKEKKLNDLLISEGKVLASLKLFDDSKEKLKDLERQLKEVSDTIEFLNGEKLDLENKKIDYIKKISEIKESFASEINALKLKLEELVKNLKLAEEESKSISDKIAELKEQKQDLESKRNKSMENYGYVCKEYEHIETVQKDLIEKRKQFVSESKTQKRILLLESVYGLDGIQTRIVKKYLPLLNVYIKEFLDILSDGEMTVKMFINDKLKVDMSIVGGTGESYDMLSGGEKMIVRLAVDIGLSLLAFSRTTQKPEAICLDEIFGPLDAFHTEKVFLILKKLQDKFSRILIITHKSEIQSRLKNNIIIEKKGGRKGLSEIKRIE